MSEAQSVSRSRLELARDEVDRVFGAGHATAHPELVVAIVHAASAIGRRESLPLGYKTLR
jgi:hypothetical protein